MANSLSVKQGFCFRWKIENLFSTNRRGSSEFIFDGHRWMLMLEHDYSQVNVRIYKTDSEKLTRKCTTRCFIEDKTENPVKSMGNCLDDGNFSTKNIWWIPKNAIQEQRDTLLVDGSLILVVMLLPDDPRENQETQRVSHKYVQTSANIDTVACLEDLSDDLHQLVDSASESDIELVCEERTFPAHKDILSVRSKVFSAMFRSDMKENHSGVIVITDIDASTLDQFLQYIYSGKLPDVSLDSTLKLYAAADKYAVESLKKLCSKLMAENLTRENACKTLEIADSHGDNDLKDVVINFMRNIELLQDAGIWFEFHNEHPKLASEVIYQVYKKRCYSEQS